jgi:hypothetical protein
MSLYRISGTQTRPPPQVSAGDLRPWFDDCNRRIRERPSDFSIWTERAQRFLRMNYPELAAGDARKATLLYHELYGAPDDSDSETYNQRREAWCKAAQVLCQALIDCHCEADALTVAEERKYSLYDLTVLLLTQHRYVKPRSYLGWCFIIDFHPK